jgi:hypothetical protein
VLELLGSSLDFLTLSNVAAAQPWLERKDPQRREKSHCIVNNVVMHSSGILIYYQMSNIYNAYALNCNQVLILMTENFARPSILRHHTLDQFAHQVDVLLLLQDLLAYSSLMQLRV